MNKALQSFATVASQNSLTMSVQQKRLLLTDQSARQQRRKSFAHLLLFLHSIGSCVALTMISSDPSVARGILDVAIAQQLTQ